MSQPEHVTRLVCEHFATSVQEQRLVTWCPRFAIKCRIVSGETVDADTLAHRSLPEDEVPGRLWIKIFHRDGENAERIRWNAGFEKVQDVASKNLRIIGDWIAARHEGRVIDLNRWKHFHFHRKKCGCKLP